MKVSSKRDDVDSQLTAFDLLASLAGKLLEESESSSTSTYGDSQEDHHLVVNIKQENVYNNKPCKSELSHQGNLSSKSPSENTSETCLQVSSLENDCVLEQAPVSDCSKIALGLKQPLVGCGNKNEDCAVHVEQGEATNGLMIPDTISLKDLSHESVHMPPGKDGGVLNGSLEGYMNQSKLVCRDDDDEKYCKFFKFSDKCNKSYRTMTRVGHRRIKKSKYGRAFPRSKCFEDTKTGLYKILLCFSFTHPFLALSLFLALVCICLDGCLKALYRKRKLCYGYNQWKHETVHRKRRLSDKGLVVTSDEGLSSESVTNSPQKGESGTYHSI